MKLIPRLALVVAVLGTLSFATAQESAADLADERGLGSDSTVEQSASQLAEQRGESINPNDSEESAAQLAEQMGTAIAPKDTEESAASLASQQGDAIAPGDSEESASQLATENLGSPAPSQPTTTPGTAAANSVYSMPEGVNGTINAIAVQSDGSVVIGGEFNQVGGKPRSNVARLNADGSLDETFLASATDGVKGTVAALAIDSQGGILVGGTFNEANEAEASNLVRFQTDGTLDTAFSQSAGPNGKVLSIAVLPSGNVVIGGEFSQVGNQERKNIAQLSPTGQLTSNPTSSEITGSVAALGVKPDGGIVAVGQFDSAKGGRNVIELAH